MAAELLVGQGYGCGRRADDLLARWQQPAQCQPVEPGKDLSLDEVARRPEEHDDMIFGARRFGPRGRGQVVGVDLPHVGLTLLPAPSLLGGPLAGTTSRAEGVGFEPTVPCDTAVFETARFGHSRIPPGDTLGARRARATAVRRGRASGPPQRLKETLHHLRRPVCCDTPDEGYLMVEPGICAEVVERSASACLRIGGAEDEATEPGRDACSRAHGARLERHHESRISEPPAADRGRGISKGKHLSVCGRIARKLPLVVTSSHDLVADEHDRADGHVPMSKCEARLVQSCGHGRGLDAGRLARRWVAGRCRQIGGHVQIVEPQRGNRPVRRARPAGAFRLVVVVQCRRCEPAVVALAGGGAVHPDD